MVKNIWTTCTVVFAALIMSFSISTPSGAETWKMAIADATGSPQYETGKKFAEIKNEIMISTYKAWGINPSPMVWSELFPALQQGVVDGQDNPYTIINAMKFFEVQKYITPLHYLFSLEPLVISEQVFQSQTPEMQKLLLEAGKQTSLHSQKYLAESEESIKKRLVEEKGMVITLPANDEKEWIEKATTAVWPKYYKSIGGKEKLEEILKSVGRSL